MGKSGLGTGERGRSPDAAQHDAGAKARPRLVDCVVPELQKKLGLLVRYGYFDSFDAVAAALGRKAKTVRWWGHGDAARGGGRIPADRYEQVMALFRDCLLPDVPESLVDEIVLGPASEMEEQLGPSDPKSIRDFIRSEGVAGAGRLFVGKENEIGLVETDQDRPAIKFRVPLDAWFRIVVEKDLRRRTILALQLTPSACGIVGHAVDPGTGHVLVPGLMEDGSLAWMRERRDNGLNRFAVIGLNKLLPADIPSEGGQVLTEALQNRLGYVYGQREQDEREIHLMTIDILKPG